MLWLQADYFLSSAFFFFSAAAFAGSMRSFTVSIGLPASPRNFLTMSGVIADALFPKLLRMYVRTSAISLSVMAAFGGMAEEYFLPATVMGPVSPRSWMRMRFSAGPLTHSDFAIGGNAFGMPAPVAWWHAAHFAL